MDFDLLDIVGRDTLRKLTDSLWKTSGLPAKIVDAEGQIIAAAGQQDVCTLFHRRHQITLKHCLDCDRDIDLLLRQRVPACETFCRNGLVHIGLPLVIAGRHLGTLFLSQFFYQQPDEEMFRCRARQLGIEESSYIAALHRVPVLDKSQVQSALGFFDVLIRIITEMANGRLELLYRERFEALLAGISTRFIEPGTETVDQKINLALRDLGEFAQVDRSYVFQFSEDGRQISNTHEWCAPGVSCEKDQLQNVPVAEVPSFIPRILAGEIVQVGRVADLPPESDAEKVHFQRQNIQSLLIVPIFTGGKVTGFLGFDWVRSEKSWVPRDITLLRTAAEILGNALERHRAAEALAYRMRLEHLIATISTRMANLPSESVNAAIDSVLGELGLFVGAHRCYVFEFSDEFSKMSNTHEWVAPGIGSFKRDLQRLTTADLPWFASRMIAGREPVYIPEVAALPEDAAAEKKEWEREEIRSLLCIPILLKESLLGFIGFDSVGRKRQWPEEIILLLRMVGECFANALDRRRNDEILRAREAALENALDDAQTARDKIAAILGSVTAGLLVTEPEGRIVLVNQPAADILGFAIQDLDSIDAIRGVPQLVDQIRSVLARGETSDPVECSLPSGSRQPHVVYARTSPIPSGGAVTLLRDVTRQRRVEQMKSEFILTAAHELRTPLTSVMGYSELLLADGTESRLAPEKRREYLSVIHRKSEVLTSIVNDLLDLGRIDTGQPLPMRREKMPIKHLLQEVVEDFRRLHSRIEFQLLIQEDLPLIEGDAQRLRQVFENLLDNAVKFSAGAALITTEAHRQADRLLIRVRDRGIGMSPEQVTQMFDKFYRAAATHTAVGGLGLGLAVVKEIIEAHGGQIEVDSQEALGTTVTVLLPITRQ